MNIVIDIGNTRIKLAVFDQNELMYTAIVDELNEETLIKHIVGNNVSQGILSSVSNNVALNELLKKYNFFHFNHATPLPLALKYATPKTLGLDRIAAVVGARQVVAKGNLLAIDLGTCVTYDFLNDKNEYLGGGISPGFEMRFKALNKFTGKLPLVKYKKNKLALIGNSTENSIISGVYNGLKNEIEGLIKQYEEQYKNLKIVVTGGDINLFDLAPKNRIFADEFLVLKGLNEILIYNEEE